jgi:hypothetical protein
VKVWGLAAGAAQHNGCKSLPNINSIFAHVTETVGTDAFGIPQLPEGRVTSDTPINYLKALWPALFPVAKMFCKQPTEWPFLFGVAIQEALDAGREALTQDVALAIIMESAILMSKVDLADAWPLTAPRTPPRAATNTGTLKEHPNARSFVKRFV